VRAISYTRAGGPDVLELTERPVPEPGAGEVRVRVAFSGVNPSDWKSRSSAAPGPDGQIPHHDGAGTVDAVGEGVEPDRIGERVWTWEAAWRRPSGTAAEYTVVPARQTVHLGAEPLELGACLGIPFLTAHRCLTVAESLPHRIAPGSLHGRTVLVQGGAGAVGNAAIQLARWAGATVLATVSGPEKAALAAAAGADHVIDYRRDDVVAEVRRIAPKGADAIVEVAVAANAGTDAQVVARHGAVAMYGGAGEETLTVPIRPQIATNSRWQFVGLYTEPAAAKEAAVEDVAAAVRDRAIRVGPDAGLPLHVFPLERTAEAHQAVQDGVVGKVLVDVTA
jgi:NADPH2:quinone reductase